jgi:predicted ATPase/DNA-binding CsgD family transcriptional regulator
MLPNPLTRFLGREQDVAAIKRLLTATRLLTLTGPGGVGKTRLALQIAAAQPADNVAFVDLTPIREPHLALAAIAHTLGLPDDRDDPALTKRVAAAIGEDPTLLVLDNFEHVLDAAPGLARLIGMAPRLTVLVTSRVPLRVTGEQEYSVAPLPLPTVARDRSAATVLRSPAVRLFVQRAQAVRPDFTLDDRTAPIVAAICARLDGLPLAIELAAIRIRVLDPAGLLERLDRRLSLLAGGARDAPARQQTLQATIAWSEALLAEPEQRLFRRLAIFPGGASLEMVCAVCAAPGADEIAVLDQLTILVEHHLVLRRDTLDEPCFLMLETVREYAAVQLAASGEEPEARRRACDYLIGLAAQAGAAWRSRTYSAWLARLDIEHDNFRAALTYALETADAEAAYRLGAGLWQFWYTRAYAVEGRTWLDRILAMPLPTVDAHGSHNAVNARLRATVLFGAGANAALHGDQDRCERLGHEALTIYRQLGDADGAALTLNGLGVLANDSGEFTRAAALLTEALELRRRYGPPGGLAQVLLNLAHTRMLQGSYAEAHNRFAESLAIQRAIDDEIGMAESLLGMGTIAMFNGDLTAARNLLCESIARAERLGTHQIVCMGLESLARVCERSGDTHTAVQLLASSEAIRRRVGMPLSPADHGPLVELLLATRNRLGAEWATVWAAGQALSVADALARAAPDPVPVLAAAPPQLRPLLTSQGEALTAREAEVLQLVAQGLTNRLIAERLVVSSSTVHSHIKAIFGKLGVTTRAAATRAAIEQGLVRIEQPEPQ